LKESYPKYEGFNNISLESEGNDMHLEFSSLWEFLNYQLKMVNNSEFNISDSFENPLNGMYFKYKALDSS
jgi:hypothetical protein